MPSSRAPRLALLAEGSLAPLEAKTAIGLLRYRGAEVACAIDSTRAGSTTGACVGAGGETPVVATLEAAWALGADTLVLGIAPAGGRLPEDWRAMVRGALERGGTVVSGLHTFLADDPELAAAARRAVATSTTCVGRPRRCRSGTAMPRRSSPSSCSRSAPTATSAR